jgi:hypothetical protein
MCTVSRREEFRSQLACHTNSSRSFLLEDIRGPGESGLWTIFQRSRESWQLPLSVLHDKRFASEWSSNGMCSRAWWVRTKNLRAGCLWPSFPRTSVPTTCFDDQSVFPLSHSPSRPYCGAFQKVVESLRQKDLVYLCDQGRSLYLFSSNPIARF